MSELYTKEERELCKQAAVDAFAAMGGLPKARKKLIALTGITVSDQMLRNWIYRGVPSEWIPTMHMLSNIPCHEFDPISYPKWMFND